MKQLRNGFFYLVLLLCLCPLLASASENRNIMQVTSSEQSVKVYVKGIENAVTDVSYQIADKPCQDIKTYSIDEDADAFRTLLLFDNSLSVSNPDKQRAKEIISLLFENRKDNEQFRIATFGETIEYLSEFTNDYSSLLQCMDSIESIDRETYLTDVLYDVLNSNEKENFKGYQRVIVISDGVDNKSIGITKDELYDLLKEKSCPIYTIGAQNKKNDNELENMFAISRKTNANYFLLNNESDPKQIVTQLNQDHNIVVFEAKYPKISLDGSKQNTKLTFIDGDEAKLEFEVKLPFGVSEDEPSLLEEITEEAETETIEEIKSEPVSEEAVTEMPEEGSGISVRLLLIIVLILAIIILFVILLINKVKGVAKNKTKKQEKETKNNISQVQFSETDSDKTEIRSSDYFHCDDDKTEIVFDNWKSKQADFDLKSGTCLTLTEKNGLQRDYIYKLTDKVVIGRSIDKCQICISDDKSISGAHCEIGEREGCFYIKDLNSGNGTYLNGNRIYLDSEIVNGDQLRLGRTELIVKIN